MKSVNAPLDQEIKKLDEAFNDHWQSCPICGEDSEGQPSNLCLRGAILKARADSLSSAEWMRSKPG